MMSTRPIIGITLVLLLCNLIHSFPTEDIPTAKPDADHSLSQSESVSGSEDINSSKIKDTTGSTPSSDVELLSKPELQKSHDKKDEGMANSDETDEEILIILQNCSEAKTISKRETDRVNQVNDDSKKDRNTSNNGAEDDEDSGEKDDDMSPKKNSSGTENLHEVSLTFSGTDSNEESRTTARINNLEDDYISLESSNDANSNGTDTTVLEGSSMMNNDSLALGSKGEDTVLIPLQARPRPIFIEVIFFKLNNETSYNIRNSTEANESTGPHITSESSLETTTGAAAERRVTHMKKHTSMSDEEQKDGNASEDSDATPSKTLNLEEENESSTKAFSKGLGNRRRRDTIFSHLTNNSHSDSLEDGKHSSKKNHTLTGKSSSSNSLQDQQESNNADTASNPPTTTDDVSGESSISSSSGLDHPSGNSSSSKGNSTTDSKTGTEKKGIIAAFMEILGIGDGSHDHDSSSKSNNTTSINTTPDPSNHSTGSSAHDGNNAQSSNDDDASPSIPNQNSSKSSSDQNRRVVRAANGPTGNSNPSSGPSPPSRFEA